MAETLVELVARIKTDASQLEAGLKKAEGGVKKTGANMTQIMTQAGKAMTVAITAPLIALAGTSLKTATDFTRSMAKVQAVTGATSEEFKDLNDLAKELGRTTQFTASEVASAMSFMGMAGMDTNTIMQALPDTLNLAAAGALDMGTAADIITNIMAGFGQTTDQVGHSVDVLAKTFTSSNTDLVMLGEAMKYAAPVAKGFGLTFEETSAMIGLFGNAGIQASMAGTTLRQGLVQLDAKAKEFGISIYDSSGKMIPFVDILKQLESQGLSASDMMELFGIRAGPGMLALLSQGTGALSGFITELQNSGGTAENIAKVQMEGLHGSITRLKSAFEGLQLTIADQLMPVVEPLIATITEMFRQVSALPGSIKTVVTIMASLAAATGPLLIIIPKLIALKIAWASSVLPALTSALGATTVAILGMTLAITGIVAGLAMMAFGIYNLIQRGNEEAEAARLGAEAENERQKALAGETNELYNAIKAIQEKGYALNAEQQAYVDNIDSAVAYGEINEELIDLKDKYVIGMKAATDADEAWGFTAKAANEVVLDGQNKINNALDEEIKKRNWLKGNMAAIVNLLNQANAGEIDWADVADALSGNQTGVTPTSEYYPETAMGGIVKSPQVRMVGEAGPEAIIPLDKLPQGGTTVNINMPNAPIFMQNEAQMNSFIQRIVEEINRYQRLNYGGVVN